MRRQPVGVLLVIAMVVLIVGIDLLFLRHNAGLRLVVNVGIAIVFVAAYLRLVRRP